MSSNNPRRILIIDDDADYRKLLLTWLGGLFADADIVEYDPPSQGLPGPDFDWTVIDILLLDYNLRLDNVTGLDILEGNRDNQYFPTTLMLTSASGEDVAVRALKYGIADYLRKEQTTKEVLKSAVENAYARQQLKRQRLNLMDEMREVAREESARIIDDYKKKFSALRALEEKHLQQERQKLAREMDQNKEQLARMEEEQKHAELSRRVLQNEIQKLKEELIATADKPKQDARMETTRERYNRVSADTKRLQANIEKVIAGVDKNQWQLEQSRTLEMELAKEVENFKEEADQKKNINDPSTITLLRRTHTQQTTTRQKQAAAKKQDEQLLNDIATQLDKDK